MAYNEEHNLSSHYVLTKYVAQLALQWTVNARSPVPNNALTSSHSEIAICEPGVSLTPSLTIGLSQAPTAKLLRMRMLHLAPLSGQVPVACMLTSVKEIQ